MVFLGEVYDALGREVDALEAVDVDGICVEPLRQLHRDYGKVLDGRWRLEPEREESYFGGTWFLAIEVAELERYADLAQRLRDLRDRSCLRWAGKQIALL